jgi:hypothetical protein
MCAAGARADLSREITEHYAPTRAAMQSGAGSIVMIGDSFTGRGGALHDVIKALVQQRYGDGGRGYRGCSLWTGVIFQPDPGWSWGPLNSDTAPFRSLDGLWARFGGAAPSRMDVTAYDDTIDMYYVAEPSGGTFFLRVGTSTPQRIETFAPVPEVRLLTHTFTASTPAPQRFIRIEPQPGNGVTFLGSNNSSQRPGPRVHRVANGGWGVNHFLRRDWTFDQSLALLQPTLMLVMLGQNDGLLTRQQWHDKLVLVVERLRAAAPGVPIILMSSYDTGAPWNLLFSLATEDVANELDTGFINVFEAAGSHALFEANGYLDEDGIHWNASGGQYVGRLVFDALESGGASLAPCTDIDFNNDGLFPDTGDIDALLSVFSGSPCPTDFCDTIDFNRDGLFPDTQDLDAFLSVFSGGQCP